MSEGSKNGVSVVPIQDLIVGKNVRHPAEEGLADLVASIRANGILQPLLVRPRGKKYDLVCGHRRLAAARAGGLERVPVFVRELDDLSALAAQIVENLQREDAHALDEAQAYRQLQARAKLDVAAISARVGRSIPYVYDRLRLNELSPEIKQLFREDRITPGHAVVLARLKPAQQKRAIDPHKGGLFEHEHLLWDPNDQDRANDRFKPTLKLRTVRELQGWIDEHVKFDPAASDIPDLFPETAGALGVAREKAEKIVPITHDYTVHPDARDGERVFGPRSWRQADGRQKSKTCEHSVLGVVVVGPGRGETLRVCIAKTCKVHFGEELRAAKRRRTAGQTAAATRAAKHKQRAKAERERRELERKRFEKATPAIVEAVAAAVSKASTSATGRLADALVKSLTSWDVKRYAGVLKRGRSAEDLVRYCGFLAIVGGIGHYGSETTFPKVAKAFGVDVRKIVDQVVPREKASKPEKAKAASAASNPHSISARQARVAGTEDGEE